MACHASRQGDEQVCARCRLRWAVDDLEPPACRALANLTTPLERREVDALLQVVTAERSGLVRQATAFDTAMRIANQAYRMGKESK